MKVLWGDCEGVEGAMAPSSVGTSVVTPQGILIVFCFFPMDTPPGERQIVQSKMASSTEREDAATNEQEGSRPVEVSQPLSWASLFRKAKA